MRTLLLIAFLTVFSLCARAEESTVTQSHTSFDTDAVTIKAGDTIAFVNKDDVTHNIQITDSDDESEDRGLQKPGETIKQTFAKPGEYKIHCSIHPKMKMKVTVQ